MAAGPPAKFVNVNPRPTVEGGRHASARGDTWHGLTLRNLRIQLHNLDRKPRRGVEAGRNQLHPYQLPWSDAIARQLYLDESVMPASIDQPEIWPDWPNPLGPLNVCGLLKESFELGPAEMV